MFASGIVRACDSLIGDIGPNGKVKSQNFGAEPLKKLAKSIFTKVFVASAPKAPYVAEDDQNSKCSGGESRPDEGRGSAARGSCEAGGGCPYKEPAPGGKFLKITLFSMSSLCSERKYR